MDDPLEEDHEEIDLAQEITSGCKCDNTKAQYQGKFEHYRKWLIMKYPVCTIPGTINVDLRPILNVSKKVIICSFFG